MSLKLDRTDFQKKISSFEKMHPKRVKKILLKTGDQVKVDADTISPKSPHLEGNLRDNYQILALEYNLIMIWYMMPYAARWHEAVDDIDPITGGKIKWSEKGVGAKYLENKFLTLGEKYGALMAEFYRSEVDSART